MKILLPSAKEMKITNEVKKIKYSKNTIHILKKLKEKSEKELMDFFKISEKMAKIEKERIDLMFENKAKFYNAIHLFNGLMYRNIDISIMNDENIKYLKENVYICSSLYGIIPSFYPINEHRLDFLNNLNLKEVWKKEYDDFLKENELVISLLSKEFEDVFSKEMRKKLIRIEFLEKRNDKLIKHSTISKKCRGKFLTHLIINNITNLDEIKKIEVDDFKFDAKRSDFNNFYYVR